MGRLDVRKKTVDQGEETLFDSLEYVDFDEFPDIEKELQNSQQRCGTKDVATKSSRRRVEDRLEELRLQRELATLDDWLH